MGNYFGLLSFYILVLLFVAIILAGEAANITVANKCNFTVWPAMVSTNNELETTQVSSGFYLQSGWETSVSVWKWAGLIWGRTLCSFDNKLFSCQTGDCGTGMVACSNASFTHPVTVATLNVNGSASAIYNVSVANGFNLPMMVSPSPKGRGSSSPCAATDCGFNLDTECPAELSLIYKEEIIGCGQACNNKNECDRFRNNTTPLLIFKDSCVKSSSNIRRTTAASESSNCMGNDTQYTITFCPYNNKISVVFQPPLSPWISPWILPSPSPSPSPTTPTPNSAPTINFPKNYTEPGSISDSKRKRTILLISLTISTALTILLLYGVWSCISKKKVIKRTVMTEVSEIKEAVLDSLQFDLNTIRIATNNFAANNILGEGGFGEVYKGKLENGQKIAVKRLSKNSGQGVAEFKTEVVLVAKLRHNNLVKLLGFCVTMEEKILVYEFLPNSSLDRFLFDQTKKLSLDWQTRLKIIIGIAKGLLYLHEDSPLKIIHRDLKSSNILLDEDMNPKISDFGLAKLFGVDQTQGDTKRIVGTYGYMAPEYAITGHYSIKSDVFSFGVLVLEIVSGQRNRFFGRLQLEEALLHRAWRLWNEEKILDLVDTTLDNFPIDEVTKCIHIGVLCIQEDAVVRPKMTSIVAALNG